MNNSIEIYRSQDGSIQLNVKLENDTVWLTQSQMAELFGVDRTSIVRHIRNIYKSEELDQNSTCSKNAQVRTEGHRSILRENPSSSNTSSRDVNNYRKLETYIFFCFFSINFFNFAIGLYSQTAI